MTVNPYETMSYLVLQDSDHKLYMSGYSSTAKWSTEFNLGPNAVVDHRSVLTFQMNPSSDADLFLDIEINQTNVKRVSPRGGVSRTVTEVIQANLLKWQNNTIRFTMGGAGEVEISDIVLWFYTNLPKPV